MNEKAYNDQANDKANNKYAALERLYSERRWTEVEESAAILLAEVDGEVDSQGDGAGDGDLRARILLLLGHTRLYGFNDGSVAAEHYRQVLAAEPEALLLGIAQAGLNQCLATAEPSNAMPWLEEIAGAEVAASGTKNPDPVTSGAQESRAAGPGPTTLADGPGQPTQPTQPTQLSPKASAELAKGLLGVVIRPN